MRWSGASRATVATMETNPSAQAKISSTRLIPASKEPAAQWATCQWPATSRWWMTQSSASWSIATIRAKSEKDLSWRNLSAPRVRTDPLKAREKCSSQNHSQNHSQNRSRISLQLARVIYRKDRTKKADSVAILTKPISEKVTPRSCSRVGARLWGILRYAGNSMLLNSRKQGRRTQNLTIRSRMPPTRRIVAAGVVTAARSDQPARTPELRSCPLIKSVPWKRSSFRSNSAPSPSSVMKPPPLGIAPRRTRIKTISAAAGCCRWRPNKYTHLPSTRNESTQTNFPTKLSRGRCKKISTILSTNKTN